MGRVTELLLLLLTRATAQKRAPFPDFKVADDVTNGLAINLTTLTNGQINIESIFQAKERMFYCLEFCLKSAMTLQMN